MVKFDIVGTVKEVYSTEGKYMGHITLHEPDREVYGYEGRTNEVLAETITTSKNKVLKSGYKCVTEMQMICGKVIKQNHKLK
tara:strand:+ start:5595 stop:5840 length:246 start_codon:yes stop_codon:yes gene_type:complete